MEDPMETKPGNTEATALEIPCVKSLGTERATKPGTPRATTLETSDLSYTPISMNISSPGIYIGSPKSSLLGSSKSVTHDRLPTKK